MEHEEHLIESLKQYALGEEFYFLAGFFVGAIFIFYAMKYLILPLITKFIEKEKPTWGHILRNRNTLFPLTYLAPILMFMALTQYLPKTWFHVERIANGLSTLFITLLIANLIHAFDEYYQTLPVSSKKPLKSYLEVAILVIYIMGGIIAVCEALNTSPTVFLGGAVTLMAAIMLIFHDTILSFVASMRIAAHDLIRIGDWVEFPSFGADGIVIEMALNTLKVRNSDNTVVIIPTYKIIDAGFKNWRQVEASGKRQIKKTIYINQSNVHIITEDILEELFQHPGLTLYLPSKKELLKKVKTNELTNLSLLRMYIRGNLKANPNISPTELTVIRVLDPSPSGVPLQIYTYCTDVDWANYEDIQSRIVENIIAIENILNLH